MDSNEQVKQVTHGITHKNTDSKEDVRRSTKLADFCGRGLVARENRPIKSLNHDTRLILSFASLYDISQLHRYTTAECRSQNDTCNYFHLHL